MTEILLRILRFFKEEEVFVVVMLGACLLFSSIFGIIIATNVSIIAGLKIFLITFLIIISMIFSFAFCMSSFLWFIRTVLPSWISKLEKKNEKNSSCEL